MSTLPMRRYPRAEFASAFLVVIFIIVTVKLTMLGSVSREEMSKDLFMRPLFLPGQKLAQECASASKDPSAPQKYLQMNGTRVKIIYGIWLNGHNSTHEIVGPQLLDIYNSGLFSRPNTTLYLIVSVNMTSEREWLENLDVLKQIPNKQILWSYYNWYEFPAIRFMWESACADPDALYLYFHNKGARYLRGRIPEEIVLTRRIIVPWKSILSIFGNRPNTTHLGIGGQGWQWINFFWIRGSYLQLSPIPIKSADRYYYESYIARRLNTTQCKQATGYEKAILEDYQDVATLPPTDWGPPGYALIYCNEKTVDPFQLWRTIYHPQLINSFT